MDELYKLLPILIFVVIAIINVLANVLMKSRRQQKRRSEGEESGGPSRTWSYQATANDIRDFLKKTQQKARESSGAATRTEARRPSASSGPSGMPAGRVVPQKTGAPSPPPPRGASAAYARAQGQKATGRQRARREQEEQRRREAERQRQAREEEARRAREEEQPAEKPWWHEEKPERAERPSRSDRRRQASSRQQQLRRAARQEIAATEASQRSVSELEEEIYETTEAAEATTFETGPAVEIPELDRDKLREAIVLSELLRKPVSLRPRRL